LTAKFFWHNRHGLVHFVIRRVILFVFFLRLHERKACPPALFKFIIVITPSSHANAFPGGGHMDKIGEFTAWIFMELKPVLDWAVGNWAVTSVVLVMLIYWGGRQKRLDRHHL
jgi:hypothetical protein